MTDLEAIAKDAAERVHKNGGCVSQMAFAPILFALQDAFPTPVAETAGEAVAWQIEDSDDGWVDFKPMNAAQKDPAIWAKDGWKVRALYASPVPAQDDDKLRIAVEAIKKAKDLDVSLLHDGYDSGAGGGSYVYADVVRTAELFPLLDQALAALKSTAAKEGGSK